MDKAMPNLMRLIPIILGLAIQAGTDEGLAAQATGDDTTAQPRIALVIGNSAYRDIPLANPANDARLMAETLRGLGFDVALEIDADQKAMKYAIVEFGERLETAGRDAVGLFFYAGHGLQVGGENFLVPLAAKIEKESHVAIEAVSAGWVLGEMEFAKNRMNIVILDACRNNPLSRSFRSAVRGLARMDAPRGSIVAYSTAPGQVARDGEGANSPYTAALARQMKVPGVSLERMFKQTRIAVMAETDEQQVPWESSSLTGDFYFVPEAAVAEAPEEKSTAPETPAESSEQTLWRAIANSTNAVDYMVYLADYPDGTYASLARARIEALQAGAGDQAVREASATELAFWEAIEGSASAADYEAYLQKYSDGNFAALARNRLAALTEEESRTALLAPPEADTPSDGGTATSPPGGTFDGEWTLTIRGEECPLVGKATGTIVSTASNLSGSIRIGTHGTYRASGSIGPSGDLDAFVLQGRYLLKLKGSIADDEGKGKWSVAGFACNGSFSLARVAG